MGRYRTLLTIAGMGGTILLLHPSTPEFLQLHEAERVVPAQREDGKFHFRPSWCDLPAFQRTQECEQWRSRGM